MNQRLVLIDGMSVLYRAFFALPPLSTRDGRPTHAVLGFVKMVRQARDVRLPSHWAVVFDGGLPQERMDLLAQYKAQRPPMPQALRDQVIPVERYLELARVPCVRVQGEEADDVMASMARRFQSEVDEVLLVTSDKDMAQLVGERIRVAAPSGREAPAGPEQVIERFGVAPGQIVEWLALTGDASDNIPGVPGVGHKTAAKLLAAFGGLEALWNNLERVTPDRLRKALSENRGTVERNLAMVRLRDVPCAMDLESLRVRAPDAPRLRAYFEEMEFRALANETAQADLFAGAAGG